MQFLLLFLGNNISVTQVYHICFRCNPCSTYIHPRSSMWKEKLFIPMEPCKSLLLAVAEPCSPPSWVEPFGPPRLLPPQLCCWHCPPLKGGRGGTTVSHVTLCVGTSFSQTPALEEVVFLMEGLFSRESSIFLCPARCVVRWGSFRNQSITARGRRGVCKVSFSPCLLCPLLWGCCPLGCSQPSAQRLPTVAAEQLLGSVLSLWLWALAPGLSQDCLTLSGLTFTAQGSISMDQIPPKMEVFSKGGWDFRNCCPWL